jgi:hypothetical protein
MTPNIMQAVKNVYTEGDPMDYTWVDLGDFGSMDDDVYDKTMNAIPDLFTSDPADLMLPFEQMGIVRLRDHYKNGEPLSITIERGDGALTVRLRGRGGDVGAIRSTGKEQFVSFPPNETAESVIQTLRDKGVECSTEGLTPERYVFQIWSSMASHQYAEYMRRAMDMHERTRVYKPIASPSNSKRIRKGKHPLFEWKVIDVTARPEDHDIVATGNGRNSPRQHKRRGHFRQYKDGRRTWIPEALVGKIEFGYIYHSYTATQQRRK